MIKNFLINNIVVLIFFNATIFFSQNLSKVDSTLYVVDLKVKSEEFDKAEEILNELQLFKEYKIDSIKLKIDLSKAILYQTQNEDEKALKLLLEGLSFAKTTKVSKYIPDYAYEIGSRFSKIKNYPKAFHYFRLVLQSSKENIDSLGMSKGYLGLGSMHLKLYIAKNLDSTHNDSLNYYYKKGIAVFPKNEREKEFLALIYGNLIGYNFYTKDFDRAEEYGRLTLAIESESGDSISMSNTLNTLGAINIGKKKYIRAIEYYNKGLDLVKFRGDYTSIKAKSKFFGNLSHAFSEMGDFERAYSFRVTSHSIMDSLRDASANEKYAEFEAKYNVSEEEKRTEIEKNKRQKAELWVYVLAISSGVVGLFLWIVYRNNIYKREKRNLEFQKESLFQQRKIELVKNEAQIKILNATIDGKETERRNIAEILHNSVSALLSSAGLHLQAAKIELKKNAPVEIEKSQAIISEAGEKIRDLSHRLMSSVLLKFGLSYAMDDLCEKYSNSKLTFECNSKDIQRYSSEFEIKIHSIIEELINNIIKHSNAENANILLKQYNGKLEARIFDDGDGFDIEKMRENNSGGLGLTQIEARIMMMKGIFDIKSSKETGTRIYINVPIEDRN